jgi:hypothetical protein
MLIQIHTAAPPSPPRIIKGNVRPDWICMRVVSLDRTEKSSEPLHSKMNPTSCLFGSRFVWAQTAIFSPNRAPKMPEKQQLFFGLRLVSRIFQHPAIQTKIEQPFGGLFHQIKVCQPIGREDSIQTVIRTSRRLDSFLYEAAQNFEVFSKI